MTLYITVVFETPKRIIICVLTIINARLSHKIRFTYIAKTVENTVGTFY